MKRPLLALLLVLAPVFALAQSVRWDPPGGPLAVGQVTSLQLVFQNCEPKGVPAIPDVPGLTLQFASQSSNISWINGDYSRSVTYVYQALLSRKQAVEIPAFPVETSKGRVQVPAARFEPTDATIGSTGKTLESAANSKLEISTPRIWAGEVFDLSYKIEAAQSYYPDFGRGNFAWNADPLVTEDWSAPQPYADNAGGDARVGFAYHTRAIARAPGLHRLNPINQIVNLSIGVSGFGFFQQRQYQQFSVQSDTPTLEVRPLPPAPSGFTGAVGQFKLTSKVVPTRLSVGEPVTWTLELSGTGNWPDISGLPPREVSKDFQVIQPKAKRTPSPGKLFDAKLTEDVVLVPTTAGTYPIAPFHFVYFDPKSGTYRTLATEAQTVAVAAAASATAPAPAAKAPAPPAEGGTAAAAPELPTGLPRDPLPGPSVAAAPSPAGVVLGAALAPFALVVLCWLMFAWRKARREDPLRRRRQARALLASTLQRLRQRPAGRDERAPLLQAWQRETAVLWSVGHAAPVAQEFPAEWERLWRESDRLLHGPSAGSELPADWIDRAEAALAAKPIPGFKPAQLFRPRHLLPFLAAFALAAAGSARGQSAGPAYARGDFAAAEKGWREALARDPLDWSARYDLSLALAQENRWDEAAAQAAAAYVQHPADPAVRWQFALACDKSGFVPGPLAAFLAPEALADLARLASPAAWQWVAEGAAALAALAALLLLALGYRALPRGWALPAASGCLVLAVLGASAACLGWRAYGAMADTRAAIIWHAGSLRSIPTEADTAQKTTPLSAGTVGLVDKRFLGWVRLDFGNGQTGWVRAEDAVPVWR
ncbi:MAG TPA: BatD family protein [Opitutaceae bacterium]|nr:BatD family protein [Opitutaceae bacterium]